MKTLFLIFLVFIMIPLSAVEKDEDLYFILTGNVGIEYYDESNRKKVKVIKYVTSAIKIKSSRYKDEWAKECFKETLEKKQRVNAGVDSITVHTFKDRKEAQNYYKSIFRGRSKLSFTKTGVEKLWKLEMKKLEREKKMDDAKEKEKKGGLSDL
jgi:hypothetical protein